MTDTRGGESVGFGATKRPSVVVGRGIPQFGRTSNKRFSLAMSHRTEAETGSVSDGEGGQLTARPSLGNLLHSIRHSFRAQSQRANLYTSPVRDGRMMPGRLAAKPSFRIEVDERNEPIRKSNPVPARAPPRRRSATSSSGFSISSSATDVTTDSSISSEPKGRRRAAPAPAPAPAPPTNKRVKKHRARNGPPPLPEPSVRAQYQPRTRGADKRTEPTEIEVVDEMEREPAPRASRKTRTSDGGLPNPLAVGGEFDVSSSEGEDSYSTESAQNAGKGGNTRGGSNKRAEQSHATMNTDDSGKDTSEKKEEKSAKERMKEAAKKLGLKADEESDEEEEEEQVEEEEEFKFVRKTLPRAAISHEEERVEFRCLDYSPLVNVRPVDLSEQLRPIKACRKIRLFIAVTCYNEDGTGSLHVHGSCVCDTTLVVVWIH